MSTPSCPHRFVPVFYSGESSALELLKPAASPIRIRAAAHLYGIQTVPLQCARVLEIDCGLGNNLFPFALAYPQAQVVGICFDVDQYMAGQELIQKLDLSNLTLVLASFADINANLGEFDYVIVRRLYSKLAPEAGQHLLETCGTLLSSEGIACIGYETYPGAKSLEVVRDAMLMNAHDCVTEEEIASKAQAALTLFNDGLSAGNLTGGSLVSAAGSFTARLKYESVNSILNGMGTPCYFVEFVNRAFQANLSCVGDCAPLSDLPECWGDNVQLYNNLVGLGQQAALRTQYLDFVVDRASRLTLLIKASRGAGQRSMPAKNRICELRWAAGWQREGSLKLLKFKNHQGRIWTAPDDLHSAVLDVLSLAWPMTLSFHQLEILVKQACQHMPDPHEGWLPLLSDVLKHLMFNDIVHYCLDDGPYDAIEEHRLSILPNLALIQNQVKSTEIGKEFGTQSKVAFWSSFNLWGEPLAEIFSIEEKSHLNRMVSGLTLSQPEHESRSDMWIATGSSTSFRLKPDAVLYSEILRKVWFCGCVWANWSGWRNFLKKQLQGSQGSLDYWSLYFVSDVLNDQSFTITANLSAHEERLTPQQQAQLDRLKLLIKKFAFAEAEQLALQLTNRSPDNLDLALVLARCYTETGRHTDALKKIQAVMHRWRERSEIFVLLISVLKALKRNSEAIEVGRFSLILYPMNAELANMMGLLAMSIGKFDDAENYFAKSLDIDSQFLAAKLNQLSLMTRQGKVTEGVALGKQALRSGVGRQYPDYMAALYHNLLFLENYDPDQTAEEIFKDYRAFEDEVCRPLYAEWKSHKNDKNRNRRLRVGYVSPDYRNHAVARFIDSVFKLHDRSKFEVVAYSNVRVEDRVTSEFKAMADRWVPIAGLNDAAVASRIRSDEIDILVDLAGHTGDNRLGVFARKPAPVSVSWLGYGYTTGVSAIDYFLGDNYFTPPGCEHLFAEKLWRLPRAPYVYQPRNLLLEDEVTPLPAIENGFITLVSLSRAIRINKRVIKVWAEIMRKIPTARLVINSENYLDAGVCSDLHAKFKDFDIDSTRIFLGYSSPPWQTLRQSDIGLDCFPHNAGTTLMDMLCFGVPYVTLADRPSVGRIGSSYLVHSGLPQFVATTEDEYISKVVQLAEDIDKLSNLRKSVYSQIRNSPLLKPREFVEDLEAAYTAMFESWVKSKQQ